MKNVLLIDDDEVTNYLNKLIILKFNKDIIVEEVTSGLDGIDLLNHRNIFPDIIFLDINMPVMNGFEFMTEFQKYPDNLKENVQVNILSSSTHPKDIEKATSFSQIKNFFEKPLSLKHLQKIFEF